MSLDVDDSVYVGSNNTQATRVYVGEQQVWSSEIFSVWNFIVQPGNSVDYFRMDTTPTTGTKVKVFWGDGNSESFLSSDVPDESSRRQHTYVNTVSENHTLKIQVPGGPDSVRTLQCNGPVSPEKPTKVWIAPPSDTNGVNAVAAVTVVDGVVTAVTIVDGGSGYSTPPLVEILGTGSGATAVASVSNGVVNISLTAGGSGYTIRPFGGTFDISAFPNLEKFSCSLNTATRISTIGSPQKINISPNRKLVKLDYSRNCINGPMAPFKDNNGVTMFPDLKFFRCDENFHTGTLPDFGGCTELEEFNCHSNRGLRGSLPDLSSLTLLRELSCYDCKLSGDLPSLTTLTNLEAFICSKNQIAGNLAANSLSGCKDKIRRFHIEQNNIGGVFPDLSDCTALEEFRCFGNTNLGGTITGLSSCTSLKEFLVYDCALTGNIPSFGGLNVLHTVILNGNNFTATGGSKLANSWGIGSKLSEFRAPCGLPTVDVDAVLAAFVARGPNISLPGQTKWIQLDGNNIAPSFLGGRTIVSAGSNFSRAGNTVTATINSHGFSNGDIVTITGLLPSNLNGSYTVTRINSNSFSYNTSSSQETPAASATATIRYVSNKSCGYANYQTLVLSSWRVDIIQPDVPPESPGYTPI